MDLEQLGLFGIFLAGAIPWFEAIGVVPDIAVLNQAIKVNGTVATTDQKLAQAAKDLGFGAFHPN